MVTITDVNGVEKVIISKKSYEELVDSSNMLIALESAGVDNWDGYDYALEILQEMTKW